MDINLRLREISSRLEELSSSEYQERVWVKGLGSECSSYIEAICTIFDDFMFEDLVNSPKNEAKFDAGQIAVFKEFLNEMTAFNDSIPEIFTVREILGDERWPKMRLWAKKALDAINRSIARGAGPT